ncbi:MAG: ferritin [Dechloromonas sp.]|nr:MAG: ferritin [Dechloromonas sp.]
MANYDEAILRSRRIQPAAPFPVIHQAIRIAMYDEYAARAFYGRVVEAFGPQAPFASIVRAEQQHVAALGRLCERFGIPRPLDPFPGETTVAATWRANLERAVSGEIANVQLYRQLLPQVSAPEVQRVFANLQAASLDNHLPAFQHALQQAVARESYHAAQGIPASQAYVRHGPLTNLVEQGFSLLARQHGAFGLLGSLVRNAHPALLAGMVAGGAAVHTLRQRAQAHPPLSPED